MSTQHADRFGCESCPDNPENREYMQQRGVSVSGVDGRPKGNPVLEAIDDAIQPESGGITSEQHNEMLDDIRSAYLQHHPQGPEVAGRTTSYYICPQCKTPIDMTGTGADGLVAPGDGGEFERAIAMLYPDGNYHGAIHRIAVAHNADRAADKCRISKLWQERDLTIAHDSQPYPTAEAYEKACQENERRRQRIAELETKLATPQKRREMKRWGVDGVPPGMGEYWIMREGAKGPVVKILLSSEVMNGKDMHTKFTHWLELEPVPTLPETSDMTGTGLDGHVAPGNGGEFERTTDRIEQENKKTIVGCAYTIRELTSAHNADRSADKRRIAELEAQLAEWESRLTAVMPKDMKSWHQNSKKEWPEVAAWVVENQRKHIDEFWMPRVEYLEKQVSGLEAQLPAAQKPRVMKRWGVDGVPAPGQMCWLLVGGIMHKESLSDNEIRQCRIAGCTIPGKITHWLESEPAPTLPETSRDIIAGNGD